MAKKNSKQESKLDFVTNTRFTEAGYKKYLNGELLDIHDFERSNLYVLCENSQQYQALAQKDRVRYTSYLQDHGICDPKPTDKCGVEYLRQTRHVGIYRRVKK